MKRSILLLITMAFLLQLGMGASSPVLGINLPGRRASFVEEGALQSAFGRLTSALHFVCAPGKSEMYVLDKWLSPKDLTSLDASLKKAGWTWQSDEIGATRAWILERKAFGKKVVVFLVEAQEGQTVFLGLCPAL